MRWHVIGVIALVAILAVVLACPAVAQAAPATQPAGHQHVISPLRALILGIVEGITEYLPVSSTGHLILASQYMGLSRFSSRVGPLGPIMAQDQAVDAFEIVIQFGAILAVLGLYRRRVGQMLAGLAGKNPAGLRLLGLLFVAFLPAAIIGLAIHKTIKEYLFSPFSVALALAIGGVAMILAEWYWRRRLKGKRPRREVDGLLYRQALFIGLAQVLALWPGTSRSMVTIVAGLLVGLDMVTAAEFSFLLGLPTLGAATVYEGAKNWHPLMASAGPAGLAIGLIVSAVVAAIAVKALVHWLTRHGLIPFGVYRVLLAGVVYLTLPT